MVLNWIVGVIIVIAIIGLGLWMLRKFVKALLITSVIIIIVVVGFGLYLYSDSVHLQANIITSDSIFLLQDLKIETGFKAKFANPKGEAPYILNKTEIDSFNDYYKDQDLQSILGKDYKIFFVKEEMFDFEHLEVDLGTYIANFTTEEIIEIIKSKKTLIDFSGSLAEKTGTYQDTVFANLITQIKKDYEMKGILFTMMVNEKIKEEGTLLLAKQVRERNIKAYPETIIFKVAKYLPIGILESAMGKLNGG
ncbi:MAG: hypothetical protein U9R08_00500 [Nanoarchaeota archaeon]|nr:hypothetical protein [Nanoarchaeota archaeon]